MEDVILLAVVSCAWLGLGVLAFRRSRADLGELLAGGPTRVAMGLAIGLTVGLTLLVARTDLVPDGLEPYLLAGLILSTAAAAIVVGVRSWMERPR